MAATIAPVSSNWHSLRVMAERITASCHSSGTARRRVQWRQYSVVCSSNSRAVSSMPPGSVSSGPSSRLTGTCSENHVLSMRYVSGALVFSRSVPVGSSKRRWLLPRVKRGVTLPHSPRGRTMKRTRGWPTSGRTRRTICAGRKARSRVKKRGQKSTISMPSPAASYSRVRSTAVPWS